MAKLPEGAYELLERLDEQPPLVPDELTQYILRKKGQDCTDARTIRILSLAGQRFIAEALDAANQECKNRMSQSNKAKLRKDGYKDKRVLLLEDLVEPLKQVGVNVNRPPYYVDSAADGQQTAAAASLPKR